jgi:hypothetical protein
MTKRKSINEAETPFDEDDTRGACDIIKKDVQRVSVVVELLVSGDFTEKDLASMISHRMGDWPPNIQGIKISELMIKEYIREWRRKSK